MDMRKKFGVEVEVDSEIKIEVEVDVVIEIDKFKKVQEIRYIQYWPFYYGFFFSTKKVD